MAKNTNRAQTGAVVRYTGGGAMYVPGVPMRDLTAEEFDELSAEARALVRASGAYAFEEQTAQPEPVEV